MCARPDIGIAISEEAVERAEATLQLILGLYKKQAEKRLCMRDDEVTRPNKSTGPMITLLQGKRM